MNLFGIFGKNKAVPFPQFRDMVRQAIRQREPKATFEPKDYGFIMTLDGVRVNCNLQQNLYPAYCRNPSEQESLIGSWLDALVTTVPEQSWGEAQGSLRPTLKHIGYIQMARYQMQKSDDPDTLPSEPFVGDLQGIVVREYGGILEAVTQKQLDKWHVSFEEVMRQSINNMSMMGFPHISNELLSGGTQQKGVPSSVVGLVFEDNHLTATWLLLERFRDHIAMRLHADYVVAVPNRNKLVAVRASEHNVITSVQFSNRNYKSLPYALTDQCYHVSASTTGGLVSVYKGAAAGRGDALAAASPFAGGTQAEPTPAAAPEVPFRPALVDLSQWGGLTESADDSGITPWNK